MDEEFLGVILWADFPLQARVGSRDPIHHAFYIMDCIVASLNIFMDVKGYYCLLVMKL